MNLSFGLQSTLNGIVGVPFSYKTFVRDLAIVKEFRSIDSNSGSDNHDDDDDSENGSKVHVMYGADPPDDDELLENLTVCISAPAGTAAVQIIDDDAIYANEKFKAGSERTLRLGALTEMRIVDAVLESDRDVNHYSPYYISSSTSTGSSTDTLTAEETYNVRYERQTLLEEVKCKVFIVGKIDKLRLSRILAVAFQAAPARHKQPSGNGRSDGNSSGNRYGYGNGEYLEFAQRFCTILLGIRDADFFGKFSMKRSRAGCIIS